MDPRQQIRLRLAQHAIARDLHDEATLVAVTQSYAVVSAAGSLFAVPLDGGPSVRLAPEEAGTATFVALLPR